MARREARLCWALGLATPLLLLLAVELALRAVYRDEEVDGSYWGIGAFAGREDVGYVHRAGFRGYAVRRGVFVSPVTIDAHGLRQSDFEEQLRFPRKLLVLGDSFTFGLGVPEEQSYPSRIRRPLNRRGIGVINGGQSGYAVEQARRFGASLLEIVQPDFVILSLFLGNDLRDDHDRRFENIDVRFGTRMRRDRWLPWLPLDAVRAHSFTWRFFRSRVPRMLRTKSQNQEFAEIASRDMQAAIEPSMDALRRLRRDCEARGASFAVVVIPPSWGGTPFDSPVQRVIETERMLAADLRRAGFEAGDYFAGDGHWNERGHAKAARHLRPLLHTLTGAE